MIVVISPHLDDAVLSLGQFMARQRVLVVTVFAGIPSEGLSDYDRSCGFTSSSEAVQSRRKEDVAACAMVGADVIHLDFLDHQYGELADDTNIVEQLVPFYRSDWLVFAPLGIGHPDHVQAARCARVARGEGTMFCYEDLPARVLWPEQAVDALAKLRSDGWTVADLPAPLENGPRKRKAAAIAEYRSQFPNGADDPCLLVPERCWRIARCD